MRDPNSHAQNTPVEERDPIAWKSGLDSAPLQNARLCNRRGRGTGSGRCPSVSTELTSEKGGLGATGSFVLFCFSHYFNFFNEAKEGMISSHN